MMIKPASLRSDFRPDVPERLSGMPRNHRPACVGIGVRNHRNMQRSIARPGYVHYIFKFTINMDDSIASIGLRKWLERKITEKVFPCPFSFCAFTNTL